MSDTGSDDTREIIRKDKDRPGEDLIQDYHAMLKKERERGDIAPEYDQQVRKRELDSDDRTTGKRPAVPSSSSLIDAARAAGLDIPPSNSDPMSSISALLAAAQATGGIPPPSSSSQPPPGKYDTKPHQSPATAQNLSAGPSQGLDLSNPQAAMANVNVSQILEKAAHLHIVKFQAQMQLYYYMQKLQTAGMGNPKERKECPICGKTLYDRSTWNRHMRIHTGKFNPKKFRFDQH